MKLSSSLIKGLTEEQTKELEVQMNSRLAKQIRKVLQEYLDSCLEREEASASEGYEAILPLIGERRGYRRVLNLLPEE